MSRKSPPGGSGWQSSTNYRPLNVRDALSYLDQVKVGACLSIPNVTTPPIHPAVPPHEVAVPVT